MLRRRDDSHRRREIVRRRALLGEPSATQLPDAARLASLGCGNPTAVAELHEGETVLDLGSGGGIDVLLSARRVGPHRQGLRPRHDRRDARAGAPQPARRPASRTSSSLQGTIEDVPLPDDSVDVIISNCVINLSADKPRVFREAARVLRPGRALRRHRRRRRPRHGRGDARATCSSGPGASPVR